MNCRFVDILLQVRIIRSDKCIPEIPSMIRKNIIRCRKTKCSQILDENTAVVLVFPSPKIWICHSLEIKTARWWIISSIDNPL